MDLATLFQPDVFLKFLAALLALLNPIYAIPIFLGLTQGYAPAERNRTALTASITVAATGVIATVIGEEILGVFGIDIPSFRIAGGIIILGIALAMLNADPRRQAMFRRPLRVASAEATSRSCRSRSR